MPKTKLTNISPGARGVRDTGGNLVMIEPRQSAELDLDSSEKKDAEATGYFMFGQEGENAGEEGDLSKLTNKALMELLDAEGIDYETDDNKASLVRKLEEGRAAVAG